MMTFTTYIHHFHYAATEDVVKFSLVQLKLPLVIHYVALPIIEALSLILLFIIQYIYA